MRSERKQEIAKAKLKKARQQLNVQASPQQVQVGGSAPVATPAQTTVTPAASPTVTPPQANVPRKAQVGRPARVVKLKPPPPAAVAATAPKKVTPPKPPVTRSNTEPWGAHLWSLRMWGSNYELPLEPLCQGWVSLRVTYA